MRVIVSLTSTFERSQLLFYTLPSLLRQTVKPDKFLVNLSKQAYLGDSGFDHVPPWLINEDVEVVFVENTGPYRKLLPALDLAAEDDLVVTADDDILYDPRWLERLIEKARVCPEEIVCCRARSMKKNILGAWQNYANWALVTKPEKGLDILPNGGAGAVYRKKLLDHEFIHDRRFMDVAPTADDLWFKMASLRKKTKVSVFPEIDNNNIYLKHNFGLWSKFNKKHQKSILFYFLRPFSMKFLNYIGVNTSRNDFAWDFIFDEFHL